ncbi:hypothetical protein [Corynebacterium argentoratense]|uniref:hypothetical protein n=1 Tax=Corynebacterium argentoratense TaxID=42817 RepID=UPI001F32FBC5|nr:hypothetical protein [Corynebacterium argentoratense]MCF1694769.1 hypothetical protein [Corynebacterium argentoratense]MCF1736342.1 hypothetical protein [Corynebacterium argentoratense]
MQVTCGESPAYDHAEVTGIAPAHVVYEFATLMALGKDAQPGSPAAGVSRVSYGAERA